MDDAHRSKILNHVVEFGKHEGMKVSELPEDYCLYMALKYRNNGTNNEVRQRGWWIKQERDREQFNSMKPNAIPDSKNQVR